MFRDGFAPGFIGVSTPNATWAAGVVETYSRTFPLLDTTIKSLGNDE